MKHDLPKRITIHSKDVERLTGWSPRSARRFLQQLREQLGKGENEILTVMDFCNCTGVKEEVLRCFMMD